MDEILLPCDCGWEFHVLRASNDEGYVSISVINAPSDLSLGKRIRAAWCVLTGDEHAMSEIWLHPDQVQRLAGFLNSLFSLGTTDSTDHCQHRVGEWVAPFRFHCTICGETVQKG